MKNCFYDIVRQGVPNAPFVDIEPVLLEEDLDEKDFLSLLSPLAAGYLEEMAGKANLLTLRNFGRVISLYAPLYLSNYCENECLYCGFSRNNSIKRKKLGIPELRAEVESIAATGIGHILLLTGESRKESPLSYIKECAREMRDVFSSISVEIYPVTTEEYRELVGAGVDGLTLYQETYDEELYRLLHGTGPKRDYFFRLEGPQRACKAGMRQANLGALLGLSDWRKEIFFLGMHARWLMRNYPDVEIGVSLPRFKKHEGAFSCANAVSDKEFAQILVALRLFLPRASISISTRESRIFRENLIGLGVTRMSAGSHTEVGGYASVDKTEGQFDIEDSSTVEEVKAMIIRRGYQPVLKDWQAI